jgi:5-methylcytosine-specific restriction endonuclease McrA
MRQPLGILVAIAVLISSQLIVSDSVARGWPKVPDDDVTPGRTRQLTVRKICSTTWGTDTRAVTAKMKKTVFASYRFRVAACPLTLASGRRDHRVEIDHLIPRSIGGADDVKNLWPQCYEPVKKNKSTQLDGAHKKDRLETELHKRVCKAKSASLLKKYQTKIKRDWIALYHEIYGDR